MREIISKDELNSYMELCKVESIFDERIRNHCQLYEYDKGDYICKNGLKAQYMYFLVEGEAKVYTTLDNGKAYLLRIESSISLYGDLEILQKEVYEANVEALKKCKCLVIKMAYLKEHYQDHPPFLKFMCLSLSSRLGAISQISTENLLLPLKNKLASYLIAHKEEGSNKINLKSSFSDVAEQLGTTYRHLSRTINEMCELGLIEKKGLLMDIVQAEQLKVLAGHTYRY